MENTHTETGISTPSSQSTTTSQNPTQATGGSRTKIQDYFARGPLIASQSSNNDPQSSTNAPTQSLQSTNASTAPKKFKIMANNGHTVGVRQPVRKRVKKEESLESVECDEIPKPSYTRRQNSRAKLRMFPSFPLDIILEIFSHLQPLDLLHLIRTTKDLRAILLHRSASSVWKSTVANVPDLPKCPDDVAIPSWSHLAFDSFCQNCLTPNVRSVNFDLRVRYCNKCVKIKLFSNRSLDLKSNKFHETMQQAIPFSKWNERTDQCCTVVAKEGFVEKWKAIPESDRSSFVETRKAAREARRPIALEWKTWFGNQLDTRELELDDLRRARSETIVENLKALGYEAELSFLDDLADGICAIRPWPKIDYFDDHTLVRLPKPLTEKGWERIKGDMIQYMLKTRDLIKQNEESLLQRKRRLTFHTAYVNLRCKPEMLSRYPADKFMPGAADLLSTRTISNCIERGPEYGETEEYDVDKAMKIIECQFDTIVQTWRTQKIADLFSKARLNGPFSYSAMGAGSWFLRYLSPAEQIGYMERAVCVFRCTDPWLHRCYNTKRLKDDGIWNSNSDVPLYEVKDNSEPCLWYPHFLFHPCTSMGNIPYHSADDSPSLSLDKEYKKLGFGRDPWNVDKLEFDERASRTVKLLLETADLDLSTTAKTMDTLDHRFVCLKCTFGSRCDGSRIVRIWSWRDAVQHSLKAHFGGSGVTWECLSPEDTIKARGLQVLEQTKRGYLKTDDSKIWKCMRCRDTSSDTGRMTMYHLHMHFVRYPKHGKLVDIGGSQEGILYYKALDYSPRELPPVRMAPAQWPSV